MPRAKSMAPSPGRWMARAVVPLGARCYPRRRQETVVDFALTQDQQNIRDAVLRQCSQFADEYWLEHDRSGEFPVEFYRAMAEAGWLGIAMPESVGGAGLGITEAAIMMQAV